MFSVSLSKRKTAYTVFKIRLELIIQKMALCTCILSVGEQGWHIGESTCLPCVCPVIDQEFGHNIVKVAVDPRGYSWVDPQLFRQCYDDIHRQ